MNKKRILGQFFTQENTWLKKQVADFIKNSGNSIAYDPFAGSGCLLDEVSKFPTIKKTKGLDIDKALGWPHNDSLVKIPPEKNAIIVTNPPYISNYSAARKKIDEDLQKYFEMTPYDDIYLLALDRMLQAQKNVVAIVPETFINSGYTQKNKLKSITILEDNPFLDTDTPVVVLCFDSIFKPLTDVDVYKNDKYINKLGVIESFRMEPRNDVQMKFNVLSGWLAVRCVDTTNPGNMLKFDCKENMDYDWDKGIKVSSRLMTLIDIDIPKSKRRAFLNCCNSILEDIRDKTADVILSPFKGNMKNGRRRRRLDFKTCRAIIEKAYRQTVSKGEKNGQLTLF